jgi:hypothetical protein
MILKNALARKLAAIEKSQRNLSFLVGFDGFTDEIIQCVNTRLDAHSFTPIEHMADFARRVSHFSGKSCNIEFVVKQKKLGGNAPILANALICSGARVSLIGAIGFPDIEPLFKDLANSCEHVFSLAPSGHTDAVEFVDGKILLGKVSSVVEIDEQTLLEHLGRETLVELVENSTLFACTNWTMISGMTRIWNMLYQEIFPFLSKKERWLFVDLADPAKRTDKDIAEALFTLQKLQDTMNVCLGLNLAESERIAQVLQVCTTVSFEREIAKARAISIRKQLGLEQVVIHATDFATASAKQESATVNGPYCPKPLLTTGGGDNFNAGYCLGIALHFTLEEALLLGCYTSGFYVRTGQSPSIQELIGFLEQESL